MPRVTRRFNVILYPPLLKRGLTIAPWLILVPQWARNDRPYHRHEFTHVTQMERIGTLAFWWRYLTDKGFRLATEVEAYKVQISAGASRERCELALATGYGLNLTLFQAEELLK